MKSFFILFMTALALLTILHGTIWSAGHIEYMFQIEEDGSATWIVRQTTDSQVSLDTLAEFQNKTINLVEGVKNTTMREMSVSTSSIVLIPSGSYVIVEYKFQWLNFCRVENSRIIVDDVFQGKDFFAQLYGEGKIRMSYPSKYVVETVLPAPFERNDSISELGWPGTEDFNDGTVYIVLNEKEFGSESWGILTQNTIIIALGATVVIAVLLMGVYLFKRKNKASKTVQLPKIQGIVSDEERILKLLQSSAGGILQSTITDQCRFSKAKTSQLLSDLERRGLISRYKRGRDKVVLLVEQKKSGA